MGCLRWREIRRLSDVLKEGGPEAIRASYAEAVLKKRLNGGASSFQGETERDVPEAEPKEPFTREDAPEDGSERGPKKEKSRKRFTSIPIDQINEPILEGAFLVYGLVPADGLFVIYGASGCGKSFTALHLFLHVATGRPYNGRYTEKALVIYVASEGGRMFQNRIIAAKKKLGIKPGEAAFELITDIPSLGKDDADMKELDERINEIVASDPRYADLPVVVVIDTMARSMAGAKEDEVGVGTLMSNLGSLTKPRCGLGVLIHHTGKDPTRKERGWSGLGAACDGKWFVEPGVITAEKARDSEDGESWTFQLEKERLGEDEHGNPVTTCHVTLTSEPSVKARRETASKRGLADVAFEEAFNEMAHTRGFEYRVDGNSRLKVRAVALANVKEEFKRRYAIGKDGEERGRTAISTAFTRTLKESTSRYRTRAVTIESDADVTRYGLAKSQVSKPKDGAPCEVEIIWSFKHEPKPLEKSFGGEE